MLTKNRFTEIIVYFFLITIVLLSNSCTTLKIKAPVTQSYAELQQLTTVIPEEWGEEPVVVLFDSTYIEMVPGKQGNRLHYRERIVYYVNKQMPEIIQTMPVYDNAILEYVPRTTLVVYFPDGSSWTHRNSPSKRWRVQENYQSASNKYVEEMTLPRYIQGMIVVQTIERTYVRPEFLSQVTVGSFLPVCSQVIEIVTPDSADIAMKLFNQPQLPVDTVVEVRSGMRRHLYSFRDVSEVENADFYSEAEQYMTTLYFSFPPEGMKSYSWNQLGDYYLSLISESYTGQEELESAVSGITRLACDAVVNEALLFVRKKIRYHDYSEGLFAFIPHRIESIIRKGYGDCKDMSIVCQSIGRLGNCAIGLVLLHMKDGFQPVTEIPTLGMFDHIIISYMSSDGKRCVVDPTVPHGKPLETGFYHVGKRALFLEKGTCHFDTIPTPSGFYNTVITASEITRNASDKKWMLTGTIDLCGLTAMQLYSSATSIGKKEQVPVLKNYLKRFFELDISQVALEKLTPDTISISYAAPFQENYLRLAKGGFLLNKPSLFGGDIRYTTLSIKGPRYYNELQQYDTWRIPKVFSVLENANMVHDIAEGKWERKRGVINRSFRQNRIRASRREAGEMLEAKMKFSKATLWKK